VAYSELVHGFCRELAVDCLDAHHLPLICFEISLERAAVGRLEQQQRPWITWAQDDLVDPLPRHSVYPQTVTNPQAGRIGADVAARQRHHYRDEESQDSKKRQKLRQRKEHANLSRQEEPANGCESAEGDRRDEHDHPHSMGTRYIDAVIEILLSHRSRH
jgi:hypothetical protein